MIKYWHFTGDLHGNMTPLYRLKFENPEEHAIIVLGDFSINYYGDESENIKKQCLNNKGFKIFAVRGNHERRPEDVPGMIKDYSLDVNGDIYYQPAYPNICYFGNYGEYIINNLKTLVIGGAYSVDKYYRLSAGYHWFANEQLNEIERMDCAEMASGRSYDLVLSHTCPYSWQPTDLFLSTIDQTTVDNTMEIWMDNLKTIFGWRHWLFGHFHDDRIVRTDNMRSVYMLYRSVIDLEEIIDDSVISKLGTDPKVHYPW